MYFMRINIYCFLNKKGFVGENNVLKTKGEP